MLQRQRQIGGELSRARGLAGELTRLRRLTTTLAQVVPVQDPRLRLTLGAITAGRAVGAVDLGNAAAQLLALSGATAGRSVGAVDLALATYLQLELGAVTASRTIGGVDLANAAAQSLALAGVSAGRVVGAVDLVHAAAQVLALSGVQAGRTIGAIDLILGTAQALGLSGASAGRAVGAVDLANAAGGGVNVVDNGGFTDTSAWTLAGAQLAITGGQLVATNTVGNNVAFQGMASKGAVVGSGSWTIGFTCTAIDVNNVKIGAGSNVPGALIATAPGSYEATGVVFAGNTNLIVTFAGGGVDGAIDDVYMIAE